MERIDDQEHQSFRREVRDFIATNLPEELTLLSRQGFHPSLSDMQRWNMILFRKGWAAPHWPAAFGGCGWTPLKRHIFDQECWRADAPALPVQGLRLAGPVIYTYGSDAQRDRYLPGILSGEDFWCQGFSEPQAGSDLASLRTRAVRDGDEYVVNGQKIWTSEAHFADWMFCLVRTDASAQKQRGISMLLIDMKTPGIRVRPLVSIDGQHSLNEVFLTDVRVPAENLVGEEGNGWSYAKFILGNERVGTAEAPRCRHELEVTKRIAHAEVKAGRPLIEDPVFAARVAELEIDVMALEAAVLDVLADSESNSPAALSSPAMLKIRGAELTQRITGMRIEALGHAALRFFPPEAGEGWAGAPAHAPGAMALHLYRRAATIYAGSNEIQKDIVAKQLFGF